MDIGRCFDEAMEVYKKNLVPLVVAAFLYDILSLVSLTILVGPLAGGVCILSVNALRREDKSVELGDLFRAFDKFLPLVGLFYLTTIPILIGGLLCIVPGILLSTIWFFCFYLVVDGHDGVFSSLNSSKDIIGRVGFGNCLLLCVIVIAIILVPAVIPYIGVALVWFTAPIAWMVSASAYLQVVEETKATGPPAEKSTDD